MQVKRLSQTVKVGGSDNMLPKKFSEEDIASYLPKLGYQPVIFSQETSIAEGQDSPPVYYTLDRIVLFPPCTDNPNGSKNLGGKSIPAVFTQAMERNPNLFVDKAWFLFPFLEEWNVSFKPRMQWALLVYSVAQKEFYLLDPTGPTRAYAYYQYYLEGFKSSLQAVFMQYSGNIQLTHSCLKLQDLTDTNSGGHWILYFIHQLTVGKSIKELQDLHKKTPLLNVDKISLELQAKFLTVCDVTPSSSPGPLDQETLEADKESKLDDLIRDFTPTMTKQDFGITRVPGQRPQFVHALVSVRPGQGGDFQSVQENLPLSSNHHFILKLYSFLIFAGVVTALLALFCLACTPPIISASVSTGILAAGVLMFAGGLLGKCGVFGRPQPPPELEVERSFLTTTPGLQEY